jgi:uncharacterized protein (TIGR03437 family)
MSTRILVGLALLARLAGATTYSYVWILGSNNIQTGLVSTFPATDFTTSNSLATPFTIRSETGNCGPAGASPCNFYDAFGFSGAGKTTIVDVSIANPTDAYTLMNAYAPINGQQLATIEFVGTMGTSITFPLIGGKNIRDFYQGSFTNTLANGVPGVEAVNAFSCLAPTNCLGAGATGNVKTGEAGTYVVDEQHYSLGTTFGGQTVTQIIITDTYNGSNPILLGITLGSPDTDLPYITPGGVVSASAFGEFASVAPGSWIEIYGTRLAADTRSWTVSDFTGVNAPMSLDNTTVTIGGQNAFIDYISPTQVNAQVPSDVGMGLQPVVVTTAVGASLPVTVGDRQTAPVSVMVNPAEPGLLAPPAFNIASTQYVAALFTDNTTFVLPPGAIPGVTSRRARPGDIVTFYGVGFGSVTPNTQAGQIVPGTNTLATPLHVLFGQAEATVQYDGLAPDAVGLYQFNVVVPNMAASDAVPVTFTLGGQAGAQTLYTAVGN